MPQTTLLKADFSCACHRSGETVRVSPVGEVDVETVIELAWALEEALTQERLVILDLTGLTFLDTSGVHAIVDASRRAGRDDRRLIVLRGQGPVRAIFALTGTEDSVELVDAFD